MTNIYKERAEEFEEVFPVDWTDLGVSRSEVIAFHQASMEAVAREVIESIPDYCSHDIENNPERKQYLKAKFLKDLTN